MQPNGLFLLFFICPNRSPIKCQTVEAKFATMLNVD
jgi:hypothetical protein